MKPAPTETETPRVDAKDAELHAPKFGNYPSRYLEMLDFARTLERELAEAQHLLSVQADNVRRERDRAELAEDALAEARDHALRSKEKA